MNINLLVHLFHIIIVGSLFLYVGINREKISKPLFSLMLGLGIIIILYHIFKVYKYIKEGKGIWVNLIHIFIVGPLLIYIGYNKEKTQRLYFEILLMLGFASIGYHGYYLVNSLST
jgi:hypothetical protein